MVTITPSYYSVVYNLRAKVVSGAVIKVKPGLCAKKQNLSGASPGLISESDDINLSNMLNNSHIGNFLLILNNNYWLNLRRTPFIWFHVTHSCLSKSFNINTYQIFIYFDQTNFIRTNYF